jgi:hypothetical protein
MIASLSTSLVNKPDYYVVPFIRWPVETNKKQGRACLKKAGHPRVEDMGAYQGMNGKEIGVAEFRKLSFEGRFELFTHTFLSNAGSPTVTPIIP